MKNCEAFWTFLPLPLGEVAERSEDGERNYDHTKKPAIPSQSSAVTALPKGEPRATPLYSMLT